MKKVEKIQEKHGLFSNVPRFVRTIVRQRLHALEADGASFDRYALENRAKLKRLYALLHVKPGLRAQAVLFDNRPPKKTPIDALQKLAKHKNPSEAAALIREYRLPFLLVESALGSLPPPVGLALIEVLEPSELLARLPLFARRGLLVSELRTALLRRLLALGARQQVMLSYQQAEAIARGAQLDRELARAVFALVKPEDTKSVTLRGDTALVVDSSISMPREGDCLEIAARVACQLDRALAEGDELRIIVTDQNPRQVSVRRNSDLGVWRQAMIAPLSETSVGSSLGSAVELLTASRTAVQRLVFLTDGYENRSPRLPGAIARYRQTLSTYPSLCLVQPPDCSPQLAVDLKNAQLDYAVFTLDPYFERLDALVPSLAADVGSDRLTQILNYPIDEEDI